MTIVSEVYKCDICGNIVEMISAGAGILVCCGKNMVLKTENTTDAAVEKHIPVVEKTSDGYVINVGSAAHPMADDHYIEWIELSTNDKTYRVTLKPGDDPKAYFPAVEGDITVRAYCNLHGLWKA
ncbi:MAG: desulfoferrodoxin [Desulfotalea sp.]